MAANETKIVLTAEDKTANALASVNRGLQSMGLAAGAASSALGAIGVTFSGAAAVALVKGTIDAADGFNDLSQRIGINIKDLAGWTLAANQSGTSMESVAKGVKSLSTYMVEHGERLKAAGITATDANGAMIQLADIFASMPDGVEKTTLAVKLFGKAGMDMIPMLNLGSQGMAEAQEKAAEYGKRMAELAPHADKFNDELEVLALNAKAAGIGMMEHLVPAMGSFAEKMALAQKNGAGFFGSITTALRTSGIAEMSLADLRERAGTLQGNVSYLKDSGDSPVFGAKLQANRAELKIIQDEIKRRLDIDGGMLAPYAAGKPSASVSAAVRGIIDDSSGGSKATTPLQRMMAEQNKRLAGINSGFDESSVSVDTVMRQYDAAEAARADAMARRHEERMEQQRIELEGEGAIQDWIDKNNRTMEKQNDIARELGLTFTSAFEDAALSSKKFSDVLQGLGKDIQRILLRKTVTEPLANAASKLFEGFDLGKFFGGARAGGGPVSGGTAYLVGERGPELFVPGSSGSIVPNGAGGGVNIVVNNTAAPDVTATASARNNNGAMEIEVIVQRVFAKDMARNGPLTQGFGSLFNLARAV